MVSPEQDRRKNTDFEYWTEQLGLLDLAVV